MINIKDIRERIESDFGDKASIAFKMLNDAVLKTDYIGYNRIIRCIIFLADKDIEKLKTSIEEAVSDPRDVILWTEYENQGQNERPKRIRDFNKTFDQADKDVKE